MMYDSFRRVAVGRANAGLAVTSPLHASLL